MAYIKMVCKAGRTKIIHKYYCYHAQPRGRTRAPKKKLTCEAQRKVNDRQLERKLTALFNANCNGEWWYTTFDYEKEKRPKTVEELHAHEEKLLRDLRKTYKKENQTFKYFWTAEIGSRGGCHIHMVMSPIDIRLIRNIWPHGFTTIKPMDKSGQYSRLASYFIKYFQKTRGTDAALQKKAYNCSRNLIRPPEVKKKMAGNRFDHRVTVPDGWYIDKSAYPEGDGIKYGVTEDGYEFMYYILVKESTKSQNNVRNRARPKRE